MYRVVTKTLTGMSKNELRRWAKELVGLEGIKKDGKLTFLISNLKDKEPLTQLKGNYPLGTFVEIQKEVTEVVKRNFLIFFKRDVEVTYWKKILQEVSILNNSDLYNKKYGKLLCLEKMIEEEDDKELISFLNTEAEKLRDICREYYLEIDTTENNVSISAEMCPECVENTKVFLVKPFGRELIFNGREEDKRAF